MRPTAIVALLLAVTGAYAQRKPTVTLSVTGTTGAWDLNFNVKSNLLPGEGRIYFFGVWLDSGRNIQASPTSWDSNNFVIWDLSSFGGSGAQYNNNWINFALDSTVIGPGESKNGFVARYTGAFAPTSVRFFAVARRGTYGGNDHVNTANNPVWEGETVPEPASMFALSAGLAAIAARRRRK